MTAGLIFVPNMMPAFDRNGGTTSATLQFYVPGTYTPKDVYTSSALTTPHVQPIESDSAGAFPLIYATNTELFDVVGERVNNDPIAYSNLPVAQAVVTGPAGAAVGVPYVFSTTTSGDPGAGGLRFNNATIASVTAILVDDLDDAAINRESWYSSLDDNGASGDYGRLTITNADFEAVVFKVTGAPTDQTGYWSIPVSHVSGVLFSNADELVVGFSPTGATGTGVAGPAAWQAPTPWLTATAYTATDPKSVVTFGTKTQTYVCAISHTSGVFATDLAAGKWVLIAAAGADGAGSGTVTSVGGTGTVNGLTLSGTVTSSGNLTLAGSLSGVDLASQVSGILPGANGGTGVANTGKTITLGGNLTTSGAFNTTLTVSGSYTFTLPGATSTLAALGVAQTWTGKQSFAGATGSLAATFTNVVEVANYNGSVAGAGFNNYDITSQAIAFWTSNATANFGVNLRGNSSTTLNSLMAVNEAVTVVWIVTQGATPYYLSGVQVDGTTTGVTTIWQGGSAPSAGNASSKDCYTFTVIKTASTPTYVVLASQTRFA